MKQADGSIYFGQTAQVLPLNFKPDAAATLTGFKKPAQINSQEPLLVEDITLVTEDLKDKLQTVRHGFGIQIYPNGSGRYAGDWLFNRKTGDGHMVF